MNFFHLRPALRKNMEFFEMCYRQDTKDEEPLSREDRVALRRWVLHLARLDLTGGQPRVLH